jgi:DNA invertase Pin-like site-specific DNA recombinase
MAEPAQLSAAHLRRAAIVYVRQSSPTQLARNTESTARQYALVNRARELGFPQAAVEVIDEDLGVSGSGVAERSGFARLTAQVALGQVGLVLGLEVSRLARNNADWYRLLDLCALTDTLIGDGDGLYHPRLFNDRLVLGLKGTMSEAELHVLRARLDGGIRSKAARGELRRGLPVGLVWGQQPGEIRLHPDAQVTGAIRTVLQRFAELGSVRAVWLWCRQQGLQFPLQASTLAGIRWVTPTYAAIHKVVTHPAYAGAYVFGKTRHERYVTDAGQVRTRARRLPRDQWEVLIPDHHPGFITWADYQANQARIAANIRPQAHQPGGAVREGAALLQGIAVCGTCGRKLAVHYRGRNATGGYHCAGRELVNGRGVWCLTVGGVQIDRAVADAFLAALTPAGLTAAVAAAEQLEADHDAALAQWRLQVDRARYEASLAERRYLAVDPDNRLVARGLERDWEAKLAALAAAEAELTSRQQQRPRTLTPVEREAITALGGDVERVWSAPTTTDRERKELLRTLVEEVIIAVDRDAARAELTLRWRGGAITDLVVDLPRSHPPKIRTGEDTIALIRRLAVHYPDATIAGILGRQGRRSATGLRFTATIVQGLRHHWDIPRYQPPATPPEGELVPITQAATILQVAPSTVHRWLADGFIAGEQPTPGAPWRIRITDQLRAHFVEQAPEGWLPMLEATRALGVSRQTVLQRVKRGELRAVHVRTGRRKGLRIQVLPADGGLLEALTNTTGAV